MTFRLAIVAGAVLGAVSVAAGAFGAHGLKAFLEAAGQSANWETAFRYSLVHAVAIVVTGLVTALPQAAGCRGMLVAATVCFAFGTLIFSGCLAALCLTGVKLLGAIVPIGGTLLIAGWLLLAAAGLRLSSSGPVTP
jgi:uncharacterized membrane protein YgdD (TMEM256/DUF423 family)